MKTVPRKTDFVLAVNKEVYLYFGGVTGGEAIIVEDKNQFTSQIANKHIVAACTVQDVQNHGYDSANEYFSEQYPEMFV